MLNWQKKEIEKQKENGSLSDSIDKLYKLSDDHKMPEDDFGDSGDSDESSNESEKKDDADEEGNGDSGDVENTKSGEQQRTTPGGDGKDADQVSLGLDSKKFIAITDKKFKENTAKITVCLLYTSPSPRD